MAYYFKLTLVVILEVALCKALGGNSFKIYKKNTNWNYQEYIVGVQHVHPSVERLMVASDSSEELFRGYVQPLKTG